MDDSRSLQLFDCFRHFSEKPTFLLLLTCETASPVLIGIASDNCAPAKRVIAKRFFGAFSALPFAGPLPPSLLPYWLTTRLSREEFPPAGFSR